MKLGDIFSTWAPENQDNNGYSTFFQKNLHITIFILTNHKAQWTKQKTVA